MKTAVIFERFGEYHHARIAAASTKQEVVGIEVARIDTTYEWMQAHPRGGYGFETVADHINEGARKIVPKLNSLLDRVAPDVVAVPGWAPYYSHAAINWADQRGSRIIVMTDSNRFDARRNLPAEMVKRSILKFTSSALASGQHASDYLQDLGVDRASIELGYNCVDNAHFQNDEPHHQADPYFLAVGRLIGKKNFPALITAFEMYRNRHASGHPWRLVIVGDGPDKGRLRGMADLAGLSPHVSFAGFAQYDELPGYYRNASAFVLPSLIEQWGLVVNEAMAAGLPVLVSEKCGCARDLVVNGINGYTFDPSDPAQLACQMYNLATASHLQTTMTKNSERIIQDWSPNRFAVGLFRAAQTAISGPQPKPNLFDRALFRGARELSFANR